VENLVLSKMLSIVSLVSGLIIAQTNTGTEIKEQGKMILSWTVQYQLPQTLKAKIKQQSVTSVSEQYAKTYELSGSRLKLSFSDLEFQKSSDGNTLQKKADDFVGRSFDIDCSSNQVQADGVPASTEIGTVLLAECGNVRRDESIRQFLQSISQATHVANTEIAFPSGQNLISSSQGPQVSVLKLVVQQDTGIGQEPLKVSCQAEMSLPSANSSQQKEPLRGDIDIYPISRRITANLQGTTTNETSLPDGTKVQTTVTITFISAETF
jgi:hypothetical protein